MNCANTKGIFRIIQSIPTTKAEPFKRWLAKVGYEQVPEFENPKLTGAAERTWRALIESEPPLLHKKVKDAPGTGIASP